MRPILVVIVGLVGTGKTTVAKALAERLGLEYISSDETRKRLAGMPETEHRQEGFDRGIYSPAFTDSVYDVILDMAGEGLLGGKSVVLDASFISEERRSWAKWQAHICGAGFYAVECRCDEKIIKERLSSRRDTPSDGTWDVYLEQKKVFEPPDEILAERHIVVDTAKPIERIVNKIVERMERK